MQNRTEAEKRDCEAGDPPTNAVGWFWSSQTECNTSVDEPDSEQDFQLSKHRGGGMNEWMNYLGDVTVNAGSQLRLRCVQEKKDFHRLCLLACWTLCFLRKAFWLQNHQQTGESFTCVPLPLLCFVPVLQALQWRLCRWAAEACQSMLQSNKPSRESGCLHCSANYGNLVSNYRAVVGMIHLSKLSKTMLKTYRMTSSFDFDH